MRKLVISGWSALLVVCGHAQMPIEVVYVLPPTPNVVGGDWYFENGSAAYATFMARGLHTFNNDLEPFDAFYPIGDPHDPDLQPYTGHPWHLPNGGYVAAFDKGQPADTTTILALGTSGALLWAHDLGDVGGWLFHVEEIAADNESALIAAGTDVPYFFLNKRYYTDGSSAWRKRSLSVELASSLTMAANGLDMFVGTSGSLYDAGAGTGSLIIKVASYGDTMFVRKTSLLNSSSSALAIGAQGDLFAAYVIGPAATAYTVIAQMDPTNGDTLWTRKLSNGSASGGLSVTHIKGTPDGGVAVGGRTDVDFFIAKLDAQGDPVWAHRYTHPLMNRAAAAFHVREDGSMTIASYGNDSIYMANLNSLGAGACNETTFSINVESGANAWDGSSLAISWETHSVLFAPNALTLDGTTYTGTTLCSTGMTNEIEREQGYAFLDGDGSIGVVLGGLRSIRSVHLYDAVSRETPSRYQTSGDRIRIVPSASLNGPVLVRIQEEDGNHLFRVVLP